VNVGAPPTGMGCKGDDIWQSHRLLSDRLMSALGQKQTYAVQNGMSALPPIATANADFSKRSCPLYPRKRTFAVHHPMSA